MSQADSGVIEPRAERVAGARINLHHVPGGHSLDQLHKALALSIRHARVPEGLEMDLLIRNRGAGHAVPTGMPGRRVILELTVRTSDGQKFEERKVYAKSFVDSAKNVITRDGDYFVPGVALHADTRLGPDEERQEIFRFPVPDRATAYVTVKMHYEHSPTGTEAGRTWLTFLAERRTVTPDTSAEP